MPDLTQVEQTVPAGSGDADFDAALAQVTPVADTPPIDTPADVPPVDTPPVDPDFTFATLENGQREMKLSTGQVYRGKDDAELYGQLAKAQIAASRRITELSARPEPHPVPSKQDELEVDDPTAIAIFDLLAASPRLKKMGIKNGSDIIDFLANTHTVTQSQQQYMAAQQANFEAANFFRAVPEFSKSQADADKIDGFLSSHNLPFNAATAEMAYHMLKAKGEMTAAPVTQTPPAPKNNMPAPPSGTAPANTGKGAPTEADLWNMSADQLAELLTGSSPQ